MSTPSVHADAQALLKRIYAKYDQADAALDANIAMHSPMQMKKTDAFQAHQHPQHRSASPGLSPIHMQGLHSPAFVTSKVRPSSAMSSNASSPSAHEQCDHSIHSYRPERLQHAAGTACCGGGGKHTAHHPQTHVRSSIDTTVSSERSGSDNSSITSPRQHNSSVLSSMPSPTLAQQQPQLTRPADLYGAEADRTHFFALMQRMWNEQMALQEQRAKQQQQQSGTHVSRAAVPTQTGTTRTRSSTRSSASTVASTPATTTSAIAGSDPPFALWERQILSWESRLCAWKNAQESTLSSRVAELERARTSMEEQMGAQEALYARRTRKLELLRSNLEQEQKKFAGEVAANAERERQVRELLASRQTELEKREAKFAKMRRDYANAAASDAKDGASNPSTTSTTTAAQQSALHRLSVELTESFEAREKQLSTQYATRTRAVEQALQDAKAREKDLRTLQTQAAEAATRAEGRLRAAENQAAERAQSLASERIARAEQAHRTVIDEHESQWLQRSQAWFAQREKLHEELAAAHRQAQEEQEKHQREMSELGGRLDKAQQHIQQLTSDAAAAAAATVTVANEAPAVRSVRFASDRRPDADAASETETIASLRSQHSIELAEVSERHRHTVRELEEALAVATASAASPTSEVPSRDEANLQHQQQVSQLRATIASLQSNLSHCEFALAEAREALDNKAAQLLARDLAEQAKAQIKADTTPTPAPVPTTADACTETETETQTDPTPSSSSFAELQGELAACQTLLSQKSSVVSALQAELASTHRAHEHDLARREAAQEQALRALRAQAHTEMSQAEHRAQEQIEQAQRAHREELARVQEESARAQAALCDSDAAARSAEEIMSQRETLQRTQLANLLQREEELQSRAGEVASREEQLRAQSADMIEAFEERLRAHQAEAAEREAEIARREEALEVASNNLDARGAAIEQEEQALAERREALDRERAVFDEAKATQDDQYSSRLRQLAASQASVDASFKTLRAEQAQLRGEQEALEPLRAQLDAERQALATERDEVLAWRTHVQARDDELTAAIAKFEAHMSERERGCTEWEGRVREVESAYGLEFVKMGEETRRLAMWEGELLKFEASLLAREVHVGIVEKNLQEYLSPFGESQSRAGAGGAASATPTSDSASAALSPIDSQQQHHHHQHLQHLVTPNKFASPAAEEARRRLQHTLSTPVPHHRYKGSPFTAAASYNGSESNNALVLSPPTHLPTTRSMSGSSQRTTPRSSSSSSSSPSVFAATSASPAPSLYSPTRAEISVQLTNDLEASFSS